jgi:hypothetical protein
MARPFFMSILLVLAACPQGPGENPCPEGMVPLNGEANDSAEVCVPMVADDCPPGEMPRAGSAKCVSVGWTDCPAGFELDASGWGCKAVLPAQPCTGATRMALGESVCIPVGNCQRAFPPDDATLFVNANFAPGELDASHFATLQAALDAAADGDVIALFPGRYPQSVYVGRDVKITGICPDQVVVGNDNASVYPGIEVGSGTAAHLEGITIEGYTMGLVVDGQARLSLSDLILRDNLVYGMALFEQCTVQGENVLVRGTLADAPNSQTVGALVFEGSFLQLSESSFEENEDAGVGVAQPGSQADLEGVVFYNTLPRPDEVGGTGLKAFDNTEVHVRRSTFVKNRTAQALFGGQDNPALATFAEVSFEDTTLDDRFDDLSGIGLSLTWNGQVSLEKVSFWNAGTGAFAVKDANCSASLSEVTIAQTDVQQASQASLGLVANLGAQLTANGVVSLGTRGAQIQIQGAGTRAQLTDVYATQSKAGTVSQGEIQFELGPGLVITRGARVDFDGLSIDGAIGGGALLGHEGSRLAGKNLLIEEVQATPAGEFGDGIISQAGGILDLDRFLIRHNERAGLVVDNGSGVLTRGLIGRNNIGLNAQGDTTLLDLEKIKRQIAPLELQVEQTCVFEENASRFGGGNLPLPDLGALDAN